MSLESRAACGTGRQIQPDRQKLGVVPNIEEIDAGLKPHLLVARLLKKCHMEYLRAREIPRRNQQRP